MASPALKLVRGDGVPDTVTLGLALSAVRYWERALETAAGELVSLAGTPASDEARVRFDGVSARLDAALNRRDRLIAEMGGERWLWVATAADEVRIG